MIKNIKCYGRETVDSAIIESDIEHIHMYEHDFDTSSMFVNIRLCLKTKRISGSGSPLFVVTNGTGDIVYYRSKSIIRGSKPTEWTEQKYTYSINKNKIDPSVPIVLKIWNPNKCGWAVSDPVIDI